MRATLAFGIALMISGPVVAGPSPEADRPMLVAQLQSQSAQTSPQRGNVPRTNGTGLSGVPLAANTVMGMSPGGILLGILVVGGIVAVANSEDDSCTPSGTGTGATGC